MVKPQQIAIGKGKIGTDCPPLFLPDIDVYFKRNIQLGYDLVRQLHSYGVSTIKGALLHNPSICLPEGNTQYYVPGEGIRVENYRQIIDRHAVPLSTLKNLYAEAKNLGMDLVLSVYDYEGLELAVDLECSAIKIPSSNIVHHPLIHATASTGIPLIIDTGRSSQDEIDRAINWAKATNAQAIIVQHSPPGPPAEASTFNLNLMLSHSRKHNCFNGLSDHYTGTEVMLAATALGANVIEKGICPDGTKADIDISHALQISEVPKLLSQISLIFESLIESEIQQQKPPPPDRMCLIAKGNLSPGTTLTKENLGFAFPPIGIGVEHWEDIKGKKICTAISSGQPVRWENLEQ